MSHVCAPARVESLGALPCEGAAEAGDKGGEGLGGRLGARVPAGDETAEEDRAVARQQRLELRLVRRHPGLELVRSERRPARQNERDCVRAR